MDPVHTVLHPPASLHPRCVAHIAGLVFFARAQRYQTSPGTLIWCTTAYSLANSECDLDGKFCLPLEYAKCDFRRPAGCNVILENSRTVGNQRQEISLSLWGAEMDVNETHRGDTFVCSPAIQV